MYSKVSFDSKSDSCTPVLSIATYFPMLHCCIIYPNGFEVHLYALAKLQKKSVFPPWRWGGSDPRVDAYLMLAYYAFPRWYDFGEWRWNDILTVENRRTRRKTCPSATLSTTNPTWIDRGANPGLRGETLATNYLSHGTAQANSYVRIQH
jgi:hypothetical protein